MAAAFRCKDGIVLCADTELTHAQSLKYEGGKIKTFEQEGVSVGITGAGDWDYLRMAFEKTIKRLSVASPNLESIRECFEQAVQEIYNIHIPLCPPDRWPNFELLGAIRTPDGNLGVIKTSDTAVIRSFNFEMSGAGTILGKYLADAIYDSSMTVRQGVYLAIYILSLVKKYVPGVGGHSDVLALGSNGEVKTTTIEDIADLESHFARFDLVMKPILLSFPDELLSEQEFEKKLEKFSGEIRELRKEELGVRGPWGRFRF